MLLLVIVKTMFIVSVFCSIFDPSFGRPVNQDDTGVQPKFLGLAATVLGGLYAANYVSGWGNYGGHHKPPGHGHHKPHGGQHHHHHHHHGGGVGNWLNFGGGWLGR